MDGKSIRRGRTILRFGVLAALVIPCEAALAALPTWYTSGVGGFNPNVPKFYQHQDFMAGPTLGTSGANGWEAGGGWCGWVAYDDILYALAKQGYTGLYQGATDPTAGGGNNWYAATYGAQGSTDQYWMIVQNNSGNAEDSLSTVFVGTGGSVNNVGTPPPGYNGLIPAGTTETLTGPVNASSGFNLNYTPALPKAGFTGAFFTASPGIQFNSGTWNSAANGNVAVDATRDNVSLYEGPTNATVVSSDIYNIQKNLSFSDVQSYLNKNVNTNAANAGKAALWSGTWNVDANGNVDYLGLVNGKVVNYGMFGVSPVTFTRGVMAICNGQEVIKINQGNLSAQGEPGPNYPATNANGQGLWWAAETPAAAAASLAAGKGEFYHMLAVAGINTAGNQLYVADPDSNPSTPAGASGVGQANGGWPSTDPNFPAKAPFNLTTSSSASLPVPAAPVVGNANAASWNQLYTDFSFAPNGTYDAITSTQSTQYNGTKLLNLQTIMKNPLKTVVAAPAGAGKVETAIALALPSDAADPVDQILVEPSQLALDPGANPGLDSLADPSEVTSTWSDIDEATDPFGNALSDDAIDYDLTSGNGLEPGESATIDIGTSAEFADEGFDLLLHYAPDADDPNGFWMPYMEEGSELDPSAAITSLQDENVPEPTLVGLIALGGLALTGRRGRGNNKV